MFSLVLLPLLSIHVYISLVSGSDQCVNLSKLTKDVDFPDVDFKLTSTDLTCKIELPCLSSKINRVTSIQIFETTNSSLELLGQMEQGRVPSFSKYGQDIAISISGSLEANLDYFLKLTVPFELSDDRVFRCVLKGNDAEGNLVSVSNVWYQDNICQVTQPTTQPPQTNQPCDDADPTECKNSINRLRTAVDILFDFFMIQDDSLYFLSSYSPRNRAEAKEACALVGGFLAEIESERELSAAQKLFQEEDMPELVMIGGSKEDGAWMFDYSKLPVMFFQWAPNYPKYISAGCLYLLKKEGNKMVNMDCTAINSGTKFLCEAPIRST